MAANEMPVPVFPKIVNERGITQLDFDNVSPILITNLQMTQFLQGNMQYFMECYNRFAYICSNIVISNLIKFVCFEIFNIAIGVISGSLISQYLFSGKRQALIIGTTSLVSTTVTRFIPEISSHNASRIAIDSVQHLEDFETMILYLANRISHFTQLNQDMEVSEQDKNSIIRWTDGMNRLSRVIFNRNQINLFPHITPFNPREHFPIHPFANLFNNNP